MASHAPNALMGPVQLQPAEVEQLLARASAATPSRDAIIAIVDRGGDILGVRVEDGVALTGDTLVFAIDGAIAKARTAAFFSNGDPTNVDPFSPHGTLGPLTSRLVRFVSQSTVTEREVESNPNVDGSSVAAADASTVRGPGFVAPVGLGGHFPPEVEHTPPVDLFAIEHTNRDSIIHPGENALRENGGGDDIVLDGRFDIDVANPAIVPPGQADALRAPNRTGS